MRTLIHLSVVLLLVSLVTGNPQLAQAGSPPTEREVHLSAMDLEWRAISDPAFPRDAKKALPRWVAIDEAAFGEPRFALVDLNGDGTKDLIVADSDFPSGGRQYLSLERRGHGWQSIGEFQGGLALSLADSKSSYYTVTSFYRSGDTFENRYQFSNGRYRLVSQVLLPHAVSDSCWWDAFWVRFNAGGRDLEETRVLCCALTTSHGH